LEWGAIGYLNANIIRVLTPKLYGGLPRETIRKIVFADYSNVPPLLVTADGRFAFIDSQLHKIYNNLSDAIGVQVIIFRGFINKNSMLRSVKDITEAAPL
jgi:hypothetical protein